LPTATWLELPGADHIYFIESAAMLAAVIQFCQDLSPDSPADSWIAIILSITTADSALAATLQTQIAAARPRHLTLNAHGATALFDNATRAIECASQLRRRAGGTDIKISLHVGECNAVTGQPTEPVRQVVSLAAELGTPGEIVITRTLRDILAGSSYTFTERNQPSPEPLSLYTLV
jgi:hypothetical protein